jgi:ubiquitin C-terminal hydrolase
MLLLKLLHDSRSVKCNFSITGTKANFIDELEVMALENLRKDGMWTSFDNLTGTKEEGWNSLVFSTFTGQFHAQTKCTAENCGYVSHRFEIFRVLEIDLPPQEQIQSQPLSLDECLKWTTRETQLDSENSYECDRCKQLSRSVRKTNLWRLPRVLIVCVKRFAAVYDNGNVRLEKNNVDVNIPQEIDLREYLTVPEIAGGKTMYELYAIAHHIGNQQGGHCYSNLKAPDGSWFAVDDSNIVKLTQPSFTGSTPYLLFFRLRN